MKLYLTINLEDRLNPYIINICQDSDKANNLIESYKKNFERNERDEIPEFTVAEYDTDNGDFDIYDWADDNGYNEDYEEEEEDSDNS